MRKPLSRLARGIALGAGRAWEEGERYLNKKEIKSRVENTTKNLAKTVFDGSV